MSQTLVFTDRGVLVLILYSFLSLDFGWYITNIFLQCGSCDLKCLWRALLNIVATSSVFKYIWKQQIYLIYTLRLFIFGIIKGCFHSSFTIF